MAFYSSTITMMHGPINIRLKLIFKKEDGGGAWTGIIWVKTVNSDRLKSKVMNTLYPNNAENLTSLATVSFSKYCTVPLSNSRATKPAEASPLDDDTAAM